MLGTLLTKHLLRQLTEEKIPTVYASKCTNARQKKTFCSACVDACPNKALSYKNGINISSDLCNDCNLCASICPSVVFVPRMESLEKLYRSVHEQKVVTVSCESSANKDVLKVGCICELPWELMAYICLDQKLSLDLSHCHSCDRENAKTIITKNLERLKVFLDEEHFSKQVHVKYEEEINDGNEITRRELFTYMMNQSKQAVVISAPFLFPKNNDARIYRSMLVQKVKRLQEKEIRNYGWNTVLVTNSCYGCGICEKLCPQQAIQIVDEEERRYFVHNYAKCTHCGICSTVCIMSAPVLSYCIKSGEQLITACEIEVNNCFECKDPIPPTEDGLCVICRRKQSKKRGKNGTK